MKTGIATVATGLALGLATQAGAAVIYGTQTRTLDAHYTVFAGAPSTASAPDFNTFNQSVSASNPPQLTGSATASQNSSLTQSAMTNVSHVTGHGGNQTSRGVGTSSFAVTFSVDTPTPWTIGGNWSFNTSNGLTGPANGTMNLLLQQQGGPTLYSVTFVPTLQSSSLSGTFDQAGVFQPGFTYSFSITLADDVGTASGSGIGDVNATLALPTPGAAALMAPVGLMAVRRRRAR